MGDRVTVEPGDILLVLTRFREARGLSQKELAEALGRSQSWVAKFELGKMTQRVGDIDAYAMAVGYSWKITFTAEDDASSPSRREVSGQKDAVASPVRSADPRGVSGGG